MPTQPRVTDRRSVKDETLGPAAQVSTSTLKPKDDGLIKGKKKNPAGATAVPGANGPTPAQAPSAAAPRPAPKPQGLPFQSAHTPLAATAAATAKTEPVDNAWCPKCGTGICKVIDKTILPVSARDEIGYLCEGGNEHAFGPAGGAFLQYEQALAFHYERGADAEQALSRMGMKTGCPDDEWASMLADVRALFLSWEKAPAKPAEQPQVRAEIVEEPPAPAPEPSAIEQAARTVRREVIFQVKDGIRTTIFPTDAEAPLVAQPSTPLIEQMEQNPPRHFEWTKPGVVDAALDALKVKLDERLLAVSNESDLAVQRLENRLIAAHGSFVQSFNADREKLDARLKICEDSFDKIGEAIETQQRGIQTALDSFESKIKTMHAEELAADSRIEKLVEEMPKPARFPLPALRTMAVLQAVALGLGASVDDTVRAYRIGLELLYREWK